MGWGEASVIRVDLKLLLKILDQAMDALQNGRPDETERLLREALQIIRGI